ncbi:hypothetical protein ACQKMW_18570 [Pseudomonas sivasensis]|uniref:hypothetical protein n=1 Tax=Pseudomonas TaxID=286 RepID=UPI000BA49311|nr:hypothetical protein [Pseudomonas sp. Irchel 3H9]
MNDAPKSMGFMNHGKTNCGLLVMSRWDEPDRDGNAKDLQRFVKDVKRTGLSHSCIERFEGDHFPEWVGELRCDDPQCQCRRYLRTQQA